MDSFQFNSLSVYVVFESTNTFQIMAKQARVVGVYIEKDEALRNLTPTRFIEGPIVVQGFVPTIQPLDPKPTFEPKRDIEPVFVEVPIPEFPFFETIDRNSVIDYTKPPDGFMPK